MKLVLPFPPSVNTYWRLQTKGPMKGRVLISEKGRAYKSNVRRSVIEQLRAMPKASTAFADVEIILYPPDYRDRDIDNFNKAIFDALTYASVWVDDKQVKRLTVEWGEKVKGGKVELTIVQFKPRAGAAA
ncbi:RusA family crossover junction endodeoxyribonuclease [Enterobacter cloacae complex sp. IR5450]|uniref:RusA family crossover junction endodeoxyribonuclease n=1 Tax=Enterobacter cloacae complex sp. IR5450 TaxID=3412372 RepID=UPI003BA7FC15